MQFANALVVFMNIPLILIILILFLISACAANPDEQTLEAHHQQASTEIQEIRITASVEAARMETTRQYFLEAATEESARRDAMVATLEAGGIAFEIPTNPPTLNPIPGNNPAIPPLPTRTPEPDLLENIITARNINNSDGCPLGETDTFTTDDERIYITGFTRALPPGTTINARWNYNGQEVDGFELNLENGLNNECVYFWIDSASTEFLPGNWEVTLSVSGEAENYQAQFQISPE